MRRLARFALLLALPASLLAAPPEEPRFYVEGRHLYDRCGERVVLRGVNFETLHAWGKEVALTDPNGICRTSRRPRSRTGPSGLPVAVRF